MASTATAAKKAQAALLAEFVELALVKLGVDYANDDDLKVIKKKTPLVLAANISRMKRMRDYDHSAPSAPEVGGIQGIPAQRSSGGNGARRPAAPKVSPKALEYAASLLREVWGDEDAAELIADLGRYDADHISRMIDNLKLQIPASEGQLDFLRRLFVQKFKRDAELDAAFEASLATLTKTDAKAQIDMMLKLKDAPQTAPAQGERPARRNAPEIEADGMYRNPETGEIFKVQVAVHGSGKLYAKKLVKLDEPTTVRGKEAHFAFEIARGAVMALKPEWKLTLEDAKAFGDLYGCCCRCGTVLTDDESIATGLGRVCRGKM